MIKKKKATKFINYILAASFISVFILKDYGYAKKYISGKANKETTIQIPENYGQVTEIHTSGNSNPPILIIQDLHVNKEVQKNISEILKYIHNNYGLDSIGIEGSYKDIEIDFLRSIPEDDIKTEVVEYFRNKGMIKGAESYGILSDEAINLHGIEEKSLYEKNIKILRESLNYRVTVLESLDKLKYILGQAEKDICNKNLRKFRTQVGLYKNEKLGIRSFHNMLKGWAEETGIDIGDISENYEKYMKLIEKKNELDYSKIKKEYKILSKEIGLNYKKTDKISISLKKLFDALAGKEYRKEKIIPEIIKDSEYKELRKYLSIKELSSGINNQNLVVDEREIIKQVSKKLANKKEEKEFLFLSNYSEMMAKFLFNQINRKELKEFNEYRKILLQKEIKLIRENKKLFENINLIFDKLEYYINQMTEFYDIAIKREQKFIENYVEGNTHDKLALVVGGFHTEGLCKQLIKRGLSYAVISPSVGRSIKKGMNRYYELIKQEKYIDYDELLRWKLSLLSFLDNKKFNIGVLLKCLSLKVRELKQKNKNISRGAKNYFELWNKNNKNKFKFKFKVDTFKYKGNVGFNIIAGNENVKVILDRFLRTAKGKEVKEIEDILNWETIKKRVEKVKQAVDINKLSDETKLVLAGVFPRTEISKKEQEILENNIKKINEELEIKHEGSKGVLYNRQQVKKSAVFEINNDEKNNMEQKIDSKDKIETDLYKRIMDLYGESYISIARKNKESLMSVLHENSIEESTKREDKNKLVNNLERQIEKIDPYLLKQIKKLFLNHRFSTYGTQYKLIPVRKEISEDELSDPKKIIGEENIYYSLMSDQQKEQVISRLKKYNENNIADVISSAVKDYVKEYYDVECEIIAIYVNGSYLYGFSEFVPPGDIDNVALIRVKDKNIPIREIGYKKPVNYKMEEINISGAIQSVNNISDLNNSHPHTQTALASAYLNGIPILEKEKLICNMDRKNMLFHAFTLLEGGRKSFVDNDKRKWRIWFSRVKEVKAILFNLGLVERFDLREDDKKLDKIINEQLNKKNSRIDKFYREEMTEYIKLRKIIENALLDEKISLLKNIIFNYASYPKTNRKKFVKEHLSKLEEINHIMDKYSPREGHPWRAWVKKVKIARDEDALPTEFVKLKSMEDITINTLLKRNPSYGDNQLAQNKFMNIKENKNIPDFDNLYIKSLFRRLIQNDNPYQSISIIKEIIFIGKTYPEIKFFIINEAIKLMNGKDKKLKPFAIYVLGELGNSRVAPFIMDHCENLLSEGKSRDKWEQTQLEFGIKALGKCNSDLPIQLLWYLTVNGDNLKKPAEEALMMLSENWGIKYLINWKINNKYLYNEELIKNNFKLVSKYNYKSDIKTDLKSKINDLYSESHISMARRENYKENLKPFLDEAFIAELIPNIQEVKTKQGFQNRKEIYAIINRIDKKYRENFWSDKTRVKKEDFLIITLDIAQKELAIDIMRRKFGPRYVPAIMTVGEWMQKKAKPFAKQVFVSTVRSQMDIFQVLAGKNIRIRYHTLNDGVVEEVFKVPEVLELKKKADSYYITVQVSQIQEKVIKKGKKEEERKDSNVRSFYPDRFILDSIKVQGEKIEPILEVFDTVNMEWNEIEISMLKKLIKQNENIYFRPWYFEGLDELLTHYERRKDTDLKIVGNYRVVKELTTKDREQKDLNGFPGNISKSQTFEHKTGKKWEIGEEYVERVYFDIVRKAGNFGFKPENCLLEKDSNSDIYNTMAVQCFLEKGVENNLITGEGLLNEIAPIHLVHPFFARKIIECCLWHERGHIEEPIGADIEKKAVEMGYTKEEAKDISETQANIHIAKNMGIDGLAFWIWFNMEIYKKSDSVKENILENVEDRLNNTGCFPWLNPEAVPRIINSVRSIDNEFNEALNNNYLPEVVGSYDPPSDLIYKNINDNSFYYTGKRMDINKIKNGQMEFELAEELENEIKNLNRGRIPEKFRFDGTVEEVEEKIKEKLDDLEEDEFIFLDTSVNLDGWIIRSLIADKVDRIREMIEKYPVFLRNINFGNFMFSIQFGISDIIAVDSIFISPDLRGKGLMSKQFEIIKKEFTDKFPGKTIETLAVHYITAKWFAEHFNGEIYPLKINVNEQFIKTLKECGAITQEQIDRNNPELLSDFIPLLKENKPEDATCLKYLLDKLKQRAEKLSEMDEENLRTSPSELYNQQLKIEGIIPKDAPSCVLKMERENIEIGEIVQGELKNRKPGTKEDKDKLNKAINILKEEEINLPGDLGEVNPKEFIKSANIILLESTKRGPPNFTASVNQFYNGVFINKQQFKNYTPKELSVLLRNKSIELSAKNKAREKNILWTYEIENEIKQLYEKEEVNGGVFGNIWNLFDGFLSDQSGKVNFNEIIERILSKKTEDTNADDIKKLVVATLDGEEKAEERLDKHIKEAPEFVLRVFTDLEQEKYSDIFDSEENKKKFYRLAEKFHSDFNGLIKRNITYIQKIAFYSMINELGIETVINAYNNDPAWFGLVIMEVKSIPNFIDCLKQAKNSVDHGKLQRSFKNKPFEFVKNIRVLSEMPEKIGFSKYAEFIKSVSGIDILGWGFEFDRDFNHFIEIAKIINLIGIEKKELEHTLEQLNEIENEELSRIFPEVSSHRKEERIKAAFFDSKVFAFSYLLNISKQDKDTENIIKWALDNKNNLEAVFFFGQDVFNFEIASQIADEIDLEDGDRSYVIIRSLELLRKGHDKESVLNDLKEDMRMSQQQKVKPTVGTEIEIGKQYADLVPDNFLKAVLLNFRNMQIPTSNDEIIEFSIGKTETSERQIKIIDYLIKHNFIPEGVFSLHVNVGIQEEKVKQIDEEKIKQDVLKIVFPVMLLLSHNERIKKAKYYKRIEIHKQSGNLRIEFRPLNIIVGEDNIKNSGIIENVDQAQIYERSIKIVQDLSMILLSSIKKEQVKDNLDEDLTELFEKYKEDLMELLEENNFTETIEKVWTQYAEERVNAEKREQNPQIKAYIDDLITDVQTQISMLIQRNIQNKKAESVERKISKLMNSYMVFPEQAVDIISELKDENRFYDEFRKIGEEIMGRGMEMMYLGEYKRAVRFCGSAAKIFDTLGEIRLAAYCYEAAGFGSQYLEDHEASGEYFRYAAENWGLYAKNSLKKIEPDLFNEPYEWNTIERKKEIKNIIWQYVLKNYQNASKEFINNKDYQRAGKCYEQAGNFMEDRIGWFNIKLADVKEYYVLARDNFEKAGNYNGVSRCDEKILQFESSTFAGGVAPFGIDMIDKLPDDIEKIEDENLAGLLSGLYNTLGKREDPYAREKLAKWCAQNPKKFIEKSKQAVYYLKQLLPKQADTSVNYYLSAENILSGILKQQDLIDELKENEKHIFLFDYFFGFKNSDFLNDYKIYADEIYDILTDNTKERINKKAYAFLKRNIPGAEHYPEIVKITARVIMTDEIRNIINLEKIYTDEPNLMTVSEVSDMEKGREKEIKISIDRWFKNNREYEKYMLLHEAVERINLERDSKGNITEQEFKKEPVNLREAHEIALKAEKLAVERAGRNWLIYNHDMIENFEVEGIFSAGRMGVVRPSGVAPLEHSELPEQPAAINIIENRKMPGIDFRLNRLSVLRGWNIYEDDSGVYYISRKDFNSYMQELNALLKAGIKKRGLKEFDSETELEDYIGKRDEQLFRNPVPNIVAQESYYDKFKQKYIYYEVFMEALPGIEEWLKYNNINFTKYSDGTIEINNEVADIYLSKLAEESYYKKIYTPWNVDPMEPKDTVRFRIKENNYATLREIVNKDPNLYEGIKTILPKGEYERETTDRELIKEISEYLKELGLRYTEKDARQAFKEIFNVDSFSRYLIYPSIRPENIPEEEVRHIINYIKEYGIISELIGEIKDKAGDRREKGLYKSIIQRLEQIEIRIADDKEKVTLNYAPGGYYVLSIPSFCAKRMLRIRDRSPLLFKEIIKAVLIHETAHTYNEKAEKGDGSILSQDYDTEYQTNMRSIAGILYNGEEYLIYAMLLGVGAEIMYENDHIIDGSADKEFYAHTFSHIKSEKIEQIQKWEKILRKMIDDNSGLLDDFLLDSDFRTKITRNVNVLEKHISDLDFNKDDLIINMDTSKLKITLLSIDEVIKEIRGYNGNIDLNADIKNRSLENRKKIINQIIEEANKYFGAKKYLKATKRYEYIAKQYEYMGFLNKAANFYTTAAVAIDDVDPDRAVSDHKKAINLYKELNRDKDAIMNYTWMSHLYESKYDYEESGDCYMSAAEICEELNLQGNANAKERAHYNYIKARDRYDWAIQDAKWFGDIQKIDDLEEKRNCVDTKVIELEDELYDEWVKQREKEIEEARTNNELIRFNIYPDIVISDVHKASYIEENTCNPKEIFLALELDEIKAEKYGNMIKANSKAEKDGIYYIDYDFYRKLEENIGMKQNEKIYMNSGIPVEAVLWINVFFEKIWNKTKQWINKKSLNLGAIERNKNLEYDIVKKEEIKIGRAYNYLKNMNLFHRTCERALDEISKEIEHQIKKQKKNKNQEIYKFIKNKIDNTKIKISKTEDKIRIYDSKNTITEIIIPAFAAQRMMMLSKRKSYTAKHILKAIFMHEIAHTYGYASNNADIYSDEYQANVQALPGLIYDKEGYLLYMSLLAVGAKIAYEGIDEVDFPVNKGFYEKFAPINNEEIKKVDVYEKIIRGIINHDNHNFEKKFIIDRKFRERILDSAYLLNDYLENINLKKDYAIITMNNRELRVILLKLNKNTRFRKTKEMQKKYVLDKDRKKVMEMDNRIRRIIADIIEKHYDSFSSEKISRIQNDITKIYGGYEVAGYLYEGVNSPISAAKCYMKAGKICNLKKKKRYDYYKKAVNLYVGQGYFKQAVNASMELADEYFRAGKSMEAARYREKAAGISEDNLGDKFSAHYNYIQARFILNYIVSVKNKRDINQINNELEFLNKKIVSIENQIKDEWYRDRDEKIRKAYETGEKVKFNIVPEVVSRGFKEFTKLQEKPLNLFDYLRQFELTNAQRNELMKKIRSKYEQDENGVYFVHAEIFSEITKEKKENTYKDKTYFGAGLPYKGVKNIYDRLERDILSGMKRRVEGPGGGMISPGKKIYLNELKGVNKLVAYTRWFTESVINWTVTQAYFPLSFIASKGKKVNRYAPFVLSSGKNSLYSIGIILKDLIYKGFGLRSGIKDKNIINPFLNGISMLLGAA